MTQAVLALGSNMGDRARWLRFARREIAALPETRLLKTASDYDTAPVGVPEAFQGRRFLNSAVLIETALSPHALLAACHEIERNAGRVRTIPNGPRPLDIDIILYGDLRLAAPELTLPHPRAREREFVLAPLRELFPEGLPPL